MSAAPASRRPGPPQAPPHACGQQACDSHTRTGPAPLHRANALLVLWPLVVASTPSVQVLPRPLARLASSTYGSQIPENVAFAATVITTLPMVVVFLIAQRSFVRGLTGSGVD